MTSPPAHERPVKRPSNAVLFFLAQACFLCLLPGCGVQGPPQPPRVEIPERVADLNLQQVGRTVEFRFTLPQQARDGERLDKPLEIEILRARVAAASPTSDPTPLADWMRLQPAQWKQYSAEQRITYPARLSEEDYKSWVAEDSMVAVRTLTRGIRHRPLESEYSNLVRLRLLDVSGPVDRIEAKTTQAAIELAWQPPARTLEGSEIKDLAGYRVYKSTSGKPGSFQLLGESKGPGYQDLHFEFGRAYSYEIRALFQRGGTVAEGEGSQPYEVLARDIFPPARPTGLTALYSAGAVDLVWTANSDKDLAGYFVYRHEDGEKPKKLDTDMVRTSILRDASVQPGHGYFYQVTAVDLSNNESQPSEEVSVETRN